MSVADHMREREAERKWFNDAIAGHLAEIERLRAEPLYQTLDELRKERIVIATFLDRLAGHVERLAFDMPPPNKWTPQFVQAAVECREMAERCRK